MHVPFLYSFFRTSRLSLGVILASSLMLTAQAEEPARVAKPVTEKIDILELIKTGGTDTHINPTMDVADKAEDVFQLKDDGLHISGKAWGHLFTKQDYRDYHLVVEFRWTGPAWGKRAERARDSGILVHCHGPANGYSNIWAASVEAQIIEGGMGDILALSPKLPDGTLLETSLEAEIELDRDGEKRWKKGAPRQKVTTGRVNWAKRDEDWEDKLGYRGKDDPDAPMGEWNTLEVIAKGDTLQYIFNGQVVNEAFNVKPAAGYIGIQTEAAGLHVRKFELLPLEK